MLLHIVFSFMPFFLPDSLENQLIVGSYTQSGNPGIEVFDVNSTTGKTSKSYELQNPGASYQHISENRNFLFSISEESGGKSAVSSYRMGINGAYEKINTQLTNGIGPCFILYREASKTLYTANYSGGSLSVFKTTNGEILPVSQVIQYQGSSSHKSRQKEAHAHMAILSPDQNYLFVTDLGTDKIYRHKIYADGTVDEKYTFTSIAPGQGPRHLIINKLGQRAYLINELKGLVDVFEVTDNQFKLMQTVEADTSKPEDKGSADIHLSPNEKWLISSNRISSNELTVFSVQPDGRLTKVYHQTVGKKPRNFSFDPAGKFVFVAAQDDQIVQIWKFNDATGRLTNTKQDIQIKGPVCLHFIPK